MKKHMTRKKSGRERLTRLAQVLLSFTSPDVYGVGGQEFNQTAAPASDTQAYAFIVPEQLSMLSREKTINR
jgi:hypothetical protein